MRVIKAAVLGYCMGVRRAVSMARSAASAGGSLYTMGPLIHNPQVLEDLKRQGIGVLDEGELPGSLQGTQVILRAHGITPNLEAALVSRGAQLIDATCPKVKASQMKAKALASGGYRIFLAGEKQHGELIGIQGYAPDCLMVGDPQEAREAAKKLYAESPDARTALLGQTTISLGEYQAIAGEIQRYFTGLEIINTICGATRDRQGALQELCKRVDALVIVGGKESANTRRLLSIAQGQGKPAWLVESFKDLPRDLWTYPVLGISAGASTPDEVIDQIENTLCP